MATHDFLTENAPDGSDFEISDDDSDYEPSESDSGDEIQPSPKKRRPSTASKARASTSTARSLQYSTDDEETLASIQKRLRYQSTDSVESSDDETLANIQQRQKELMAQKDLSENELNQLLDEPFWTKMNFDEPDVSFKGTTEKAPEQLKTPIEYFQDMVTDSAIENMVLQTNLYSTQKTGQCINTSEAEIKLFIGLYLRMGLIQCYSVRAFWANATRVEKIADHMPRNRFEKLSSHIHFADNDEHAKDNACTDKLWKLRPWLNGLKTSLSKLPQEEHSAVDEVMVPFKGRSSCKQFMRNKPHKWGFKLWGRAGSSGTLFEFEVYQGASTTDAEPTMEPDTQPLSKTGEVVKRMTSNVPTSQNFKVFADNLFTSLALVKQLKEKGIYFVGTVRMNRLKGLTLADEKDMKKTGRGSVDYAVDGTSGCVAVRWFDNRKVDLLSSYKGVIPEQDVERWDKKTKSTIKIKCPAIVQEYNKFMGGIDLHDSLTALYRYPIKSRRWYMYIFFYSVNMMVINAWLRHRCHARLLKVKSLKLADFQADLATQLVYSQPRVGRPKLGSSSASPVQSNIYRRSIPPPVTRMDNVGHLPVYATKRGRCKEKACPGFTHVKCDKCDVFLCFTKDKNCFMSFHTVQ